MSTGLSRGRGEGEGKGPEQGKGRGEGEGARANLEQTLHGMRSPTPGRSLHPEVTTRAETESWTLKPRSPRAPRVRSPQRRSSPAGRTLTCCLQWPEVRWRLLSVSFISHCHPSVEGTRDVRPPAEDMGMTPHNSPSASSSGQAPGRVCRRAKANAAQGHHAEALHSGAESPSWPLRCVQESFAPPTLQAPGSPEAPLPQTAPGPPPVHPEYLTQLDPAMTKECKILPSLWVFLGVGGVLVPELLRPQKHRIKSAGAASCLPVATAVHGGGLRPLPHRSGSSTVPPAPRVLQAHTMRRAGEQWPTLAGTEVSCHRSSELGGRSPTSQETRERLILRRGVSGRRGLSGRRGVAGRRGAGRGGEAERGREAERGGEARFYRAVCPSQFIFTF